MQPFFRATFQKENKLQKNEKIKKNLNFKKRN